MDRHPGNQSNGGTIFKQIDKRKDAQNELEKEFRVTEAVNLVRDTDINDLLPIAIYFKVDINTPVSEIRYNLLQIAKKKPKDLSNHSTRLRFRFVQASSRPKTIKSLTSKQTGLTGLTLTR